MLDVHAAETVSEAEEVAATAPAKPEGWSAATQVQTAAIEPSLGENTATAGSEALGSSLASVEESMDYEDDFEGDALPHTTAS